MTTDVNQTVQSGGGIAVTTIALAVAADDDGLAQAQAVAAAKNLTLNGALISGGAYAGSSYTASNNTAFYAARRMVVVSDSVGDTTQTATFTGTDRYNNALTEAVTLNGVTPVTTTQDFSTVTSIAVSAACVGNISAGTSQKASGAWIPLNTFVTPINVALLATLVSGAANFTVEETYDDPNGNLPGTINPGGNYPPVPQADVTIVNRAATTQGVITAPFFAYRFTVNSGTGRAQLQGNQAGLFQ